MDQSFSMEIVQSPLCIPPFLDCSDINTLDENLLNNKEIMQHVIGGKGKHLEKETTPIRKPFPQKTNHI